MAQAGDKSGVAKNIILFIGDGAQLEHEIATSVYLTGQEGRVSWQSLPYKTYVTTWDVTAYNKFAAAIGAPAYHPDSFDPAIGYCVEMGGKRPYPLDHNGSDDYFSSNGKWFATDSASAATAWATGHKTDDGNIAWYYGDPDDGALETIAEQMRRMKGASIGVVSTVPFTHATPAAHVSHNKSRGNYAAIGHEIITQVKPEVVIGGGHPIFNGSYGYMAKADYELLKNGGTDYLFVERQAGVDGGLSVKAAAELAIAQGKPLFGLFGGKGGNFESPIPSDTPGAPSIARATVENPLLKDATVAALKVLSQNRNGCFVMIEQGDIDWANHENNFSRMIGTCWDLHEAVLAAVEFVNQPGDDMTWDNTLFIVTSDHGNSYMRLTRQGVRGKTVLGKGDLPKQEGAPYNFSYPNGEVTYSTTTHSSELTCLYAVGAGNKLFNKYTGLWYPGTRLIDNTHLYEVMAEAAGIK